MSHINYGRAGGEIEAPAEPERPQPREYTALEERAVLAFLDRQEEEHDTILRAAYEVISDILGTGEFEVDEIQGNDKVVVLVDGMKFRVTTGTRIPQLDQKTSNASVEGIHDEDYINLAVFLRSSWFAINSLADLGALVK